MSPQAWRIKHLIATISSFGIVLDHTPMSRVRSLEQIMVVIAVPDLSHISHAIKMWIHCISRDIEVLVHSWIEEFLPYTFTLDPTPKDEFFTQVH